MGLYVHIEMDLCTSVIILEALFFIEMELLCQNLIDILKPLQNAIWSSTTTSRVGSAFSLMSHYLSFMFAKMLGEDGISFTAVIWGSWFLVSLDIFWPLYSPFVFPFLWTSSIFFICLQNGEGREDTQASREDLLEHMGKPSYLGRVSLMWPGSPLTTYFSNGGFVFILPLNLGGGGTDTVLLINWEWPGVIPLWLHYSGYSLHALLLASSPAGTPASSPATFTTNPLPGIPYYLLFCCWAKPTFIKRCFAHEGFHWMYMRLN